MSSPAITIGLDASFQEIVETMLENEVSGLPVLDDDGRLVGVVTEADLVSKDAYGFRRHRALGLIDDYLHGRNPQWVHKSVGRTTRDVMTLAPATADPDDDLTKTARQMVEWHHKRLPVVEDGRLVGIVSRQDLLRAFDRSDAEILADVEAALNDLLQVPENHQAKPFVADGVVTLIGDVASDDDAALLGRVVARVPGVVAVENHCRPGRLLNAPL